LINSALDNIRLENYDSAMKELEKAQTHSAHQANAFILQADILETIYNNYHAAIKLYEYTLDLKSIKQNQNIQSSILQSIIKCFSSQYDCENALYYLNTLNTINSDNIDSSMLYQLFKLCLIEDNLTDAMKILDMIKKSKLQYLFSCFG